MSTATTTDEGYDEADEAPGLSGFYILVIFLAVLAVFAGIVYVAYQKGLHENATTEADLPLVVASPDPVRREVGMEPVDPGRPEVAEELADPSPARVVAQIDTDADPMDGFSVTTPADTASETTPVVAAVTPPSDPEPDPATVAPEPARSSVAAPATPSVKPQAPAARDPAPQPQSRRDPQPALASAPATSGGTHSVQVGAFGSRDEAMEFYGSLMRKHGSLVGNQRPEVRQVSVKGRDYHRLWIGAFGSRGDADTYCKQLSARGQDCYVQKR